jgi:hypothetical protein
MQDSHPHSLLNLLRLAKKEKAAKIAAWYEHF